MTLFIFIRHGQSTANYDRCFAGQSDPQLTEKGLLQAEKLSEWIVKNYKIDKIYSSDLSRAYNTAKPVAKKLGLDIIKDINFREIYAGKWQGQSYESIIKRFGEAYSLWLHDIGNACCTGGESVKELSERIVNEMNVLAAREKNKTVLISTHATPIRAFQTVCEKGNIAFAKDVPWVANASVSVCKYDEDGFEFTLSGYNDFLYDLKSEFPSSIV